MVITESWSSDVVPGSKGKVLKRMRGGYAIEFTMLFGNARGTTAVETRCLFFGTRQVKRVTD